jgi:hypothetical protein
MTTLYYEEQLQKIFLNVNEWLKFAEAKNFGLLTLNAAIAFGSTQIKFPENSIIPTAIFYVFIPFAFFSFLSSLISLFPILSKIEKGTYTKSCINKLSQSIDEENDFENIHFYGYLKGITEVIFEAKILNKTGSTVAFSQFEKELGTQILYNSRIAWLKYQLFKIGAFFFLCGLIGTIVSLPIINFFG